MTVFADAGTGAQSDGFTLIPWIPFLIALVVAATTIGTAWWNTRGETAALRQLKAMNEALTGLPTSGAARDNFEAARDRLAERIAESDTKPPAWRRFGIPALLVLAVVGPLIYAWVLSSQDSGQSYGGWAETLSVTIAGAAAGVAVSAAFESRLRGKR